MVETLKISGGAFITEKTGNIKDYYKITSCIGRGRVIAIKSNNCVGAYGEVRKC